MANANNNTPIKGTSDEVIKQMATINADEKQEQERQETARAAIVTLSASLPVILTPIPSKEEVKVSIKAIATAVGCDTNKSVSTDDYFGILALLLVKHCKLPPESIDAARHVLKASPVNASSMRQSLYESKDATPVAVAAGVSKYSKIAGLG